ncbi:MAG: energy transducer TonB [Bacteroidota bacterium]
MFVQFDVEVDGWVNTPRVARGCRADSPRSEAINAAAVAAVRRLRFLPGRQFGKPVRVRYTLPVWYHTGTRPVPPPR